jgi:hypothetical protein
MMSASDKFLAAAELRLEAGTELESEQGSDCQ